MCGGGMRARRAGRSRAGRGRRTRTPRQLCSGVGPGRAATGGRGGERGAPCGGGRRRRPGRAPRGLCRTRWCCCKSGVGGEEGAEVLRGGEGILGGGMGGRRVVGGASKSECRRVLSRATSWLPPLCAPRGARAGRRTRRQMQRRARRRCQRPPGPAQAWRCLGGWQRAPAVPGGGRGAAQPVSSSARCGGCAGARGRWLPAGGAALASGALAAPATAHGAAQAAAAGKPPARHAAPGVAWLVEGRGWGASLPGQPVDPEDTPAPGRPPATRQPHPPGGAGARRRALG